jgi:DNA-binding NarL/FixJ family response regulator
MGMRKVFDDEPDITTVGEAANGTTALGVTSRTCPDVVLVDADLPPFGGLELTRLLHDGDSRAPQVVLLVAHDLDLVFPALQNGVSGFMLKTRAPGELINGVRAVAAGDAALAPPAARRLIDHLDSSLLGSGSSSGPDLSVLTDRERQVLHHVGRGLPNTEIADELGVLPSTVKSHVAHLLAKLNLRNRVEAALLARRSTEISGSRFGTATVHAPACVRNNYLAESSPAKVAVGSSTPSRKHWNGSRGFPRPGAS